MTTPESGSRRGRNRFNAEELAGFEQTLRRMLARDSASYRSALDSLQQGDEPHELFDRAAREQDQGVSAELVEASEEILEAIHTALARIREKTYGTCMACDKNIPLERIAAIPYANECVGCKAAMSADKYVPHQEPDWYRVYAAERETSQHYQPEVTPTITR